MSRDVSADLCHVGCARMAGHRPNKRSISPVSVGGEIARAKFFLPGVSAFKPCPSPALHPSWYVLRGPSANDTWYICLAEQNSFINIADKRSPQAIDLVQIREGTLL